MWEYIALHTNVEPLPSPTCQKWLLAPLYPFSTLIGLAVFVQLLVPSSSGRWGWPSFCYYYVEFLFLKNTHLMEKILSMEESGKNPLVQKQTGKLSQENRNKLFPSPLPLDTTCHFKMNLYSHLVNGESIILLFFKSPHYLPINTTP